MHTYINTPVPPPPSSEYISVPSTMWGCRCFDALWECATANTAIPIEKTLSVWLFTLTDGASETVQSSQDKLTVNINWCSSSWQGCLLNTQLMSSPKHAVKLHFPAFCAFTCGHIIGLSLVGCEQKWYDPVLCLTLKIYLWNLLFDLWVSALGNSRWLFLETSRAVGKLDFRVPS